MEKTKEYKRVLFAAKVIRAASATLQREADPRQQHDRSQYLKVRVDDTEWRHETTEEFFADYNRAAGDAVYMENIGGDHALTVYTFDDSTTVSVKSTDRSRIESVFEVFEENVEESCLPDPPDPPDPPLLLPEKPTIFIGHGRSFLWRELKDHLQDQHDHNIIAYEVGARAGHEIRDILNDMLSKSSFAILCMTGEDETTDDEIHPRLNVVHELGLFQGRLGFSRSIVLLEEGTQEFSNIHGVHQIRFSRGNIKATFGDVLATIRREFPENPE